MEDNSLAMSIAATERPLETAPPASVTGAGALRRATAGAHAAVEKAVDWNYWLGGRSPYVEFLQRLTRLIGAADAANESQLASPPEWFRRRRTAETIRRDLSSLAGEPAAGAGRSGTPRDKSDAGFDWVDCSAKAAGVLYVLEGSAQGGAILAKIVQDRLGVTRDTGGAYLYGYGPGAHEHWSQVRRWLDQLLATPEETANAAAAANRTFNLYAECLGAPK
ncbi:Heme oxygenase [Botrimarina colliarenosi]|uniref:Heme oxygenase n=1 Tax=Botrimarina colliarenosi TaxID=2528001 RepID=A0A5C6ALB0_9BACT|nr:biliverdin-producing heme oxygenase [Botrimarina colliarenosi]TWT99965.1 Heme oxygenase [Botrimarina colliarenosi]